MTAAPPAETAGAAIIGRMPPRPSPLVGRDDDLTRLAGLIGLDRTVGFDGSTGGEGRDGAGNSGGRVIVAGDAGIGKSRLVSAVGEQAVAEGWAVVVGHCVGQAGASLAYLPFVDIVTQVEAQRPEVHAAAVRQHPVLGRLTTGVSADPAAGLGVFAEPPEASQGAVAQGVHGLLSMLGGAGPALVVVEDVHWADHSSRDLLTLLLTRGLPGPVSLVVTYRSDDLHRRHPLHDTLVVWARLAEVGHLELHRLPDDAVAHLVATLADTDLDPSSAAAVAARAEGNPFFAEELAAAVGAGRPITGGLHRVLQARVELLDDDARLVVRCAAVAGRDVPHELLTRAAGLPDERLDAAVGSAIEHHVLVSRWPAGYAFRHALLGETVLDDLLPGERLRLHRRYAAVLTECPQLGSASELARHAAASGDLPTAVAASRAAAAQALGIGGAHEALQHLERALELLGEDDPAVDELTLRASEAAEVSGEQLRAVSLLRDRLDHPGSRQSPGTRAELLAAYATRSRLLDLPVNGLALTLEAVRLMPAEDPRLLGVQVAHVQQLVDARQWQAAGQLGDELLAVAEQRHEARLGAELRTVLTKVVEALHDPATAEAHVAALLDDGTDPADPIRLRLHFQLALSLERRGDLAGARAHFEDGARLARSLRLEWAPWGSECRLRAGILAHQLGDWESAVACLEVGDPGPPQPGRALFDAALLGVRASHGASLEDAAVHEQLAQLRQWWPIDGLGALLTGAAGVELLGDRGDILGALALVEDVVASLDRSWGHHHAVVRLAALAAGQGASAARLADPGLRLEIVERVGALAARAADVLGSSQLLAGRAVPDGSVPDGSGPDGSVLDGSEPADPQAFARAHPETWAWGRRLRAELTRLRWWADRPDRPDPAELVTTWADTVAAFRGFGHVTETARSLVRLAQAQHLAGDAAYRESAVQAREVAQRLGAHPLLAELDALVPRRRGAGAAAGGGAATAGGGGGQRADRSGGSVSPVALTARELQVLELVARGRTNGQIGHTLSISTKTVSVHVSNLLAKLGATSRTEAAALARDRGLLP